MILHICLQFTLELVWIGSCSLPLIYQTMKYFTSPSADFRLWLELRGGSTTIVLLWTVQTLQKAKTISRINPNYLLWHFLVPALWCSLFIWKGIKEALEGAAQIKNGTRTSYSRRIKLAKTFWSLIFLFISHCLVCNRTELSPLQLYVCAVWKSDFHCRSQPFFLHSL